MTPPPIKMTPSPFTYCKGVRESKMSHEGVRSSEKIEKPLDWTGVHLVKIITERARGVMASWVGGRVLEREKIQEINLVNSIPTEPLVRFSV
ncbi:hypothetical protein LSTR_LSTR001654 [Laodelphax striatellus]|uniref:Uncharacterized protein n=1 Tax=Laodelphax striatellus TaxID=195883 RepID=A0A482XCH1_LAOST|nr:hypothetical protein LSTR_LSTR001654 [Laodelphax striatellus]